MTQLIYGGYQHAPNSVSITGWNRQIVLGETGWPERLRITAGFKAKVLGSSTSQLMSQVALMQAAYSVGGQSLIFYDNFVNPTVWTLDSPSSIGGVIVTNPVSYGEVKGAEGATYLYCTFGLQADYNVANPQKYLIFKETLSFSDNNGNPLTIERLPVNAPPVIQNITRSSFYYATQSGELWQAAANPVPLDPMFPDLLRGQPGARKSSLMNPKTIRGGPYSWGVNWSYEYISDSPIVGYPHVY